MQRIAAGMLPYHAQATERAAGFGGSVRGGEIGLAGHRTGPSSGGDRAQRRRMMLRFRCFEAMLQGSAAVEPASPARPAPSGSSLLSTERRPPRIPAPGDFPDALDQQIGRAHV